MKIIVVLIFHSNAKYPLKLLSSVVVLQFGLFWWSVAQHRQDRGQQREEGFSELFWIDHEPKLSAIKCSLLMLFVPCRNSAFVPCRHRLPGTDSRAPFLHLLYQHYVSPCIGNKGLRVCPVILATVASK